MQSRKCNWPRLLGDFRLLWACRPEPPRQPPTPNYSPNSEMNAMTEDETQTPPVEIEEQVEEQPQPEPPTPIRPLAQARADLKKQLSGFKAFVTELESTEGRLARAEAEEQEILENPSGSRDEEEQLEKLSRTLALK